MGTDKPLLEAVWSGSLDRVKSQLRSGSRPTAEALIAAAGSGFLEAVKLLVDQGASCNALSDGTTPLIEACRWTGNSPTVHASKYSQYGWYVYCRLTPLDDETRIFQRQPGVGDPAQVARYLVSLPEIDINGPGDRGVTALMIAVDQEKEDLVRLLLDHRANVNAALEDGCQALRLAAFRGNATIVDLLLEAGADRSARGHDRKTARDVAQLLDHDALVARLTPP